MPATPPSPAISYGNPGSSSGTPMRTAGPRSADGSDLGGWLERADLPGDGADTGNPRPSLAWPGGPVPGVRWWRLPGSQDAIGFQAIRRAGSLPSVDGSPVSCRASDIQIPGYVPSG